MHVFRQLQVTRFKGDPGSQSWPESTAGGAFRPRPRGGRALHPASERSSNCTVRSGAFSDVSPRQRIVTREIDIPEALIRSRHFEKYFRRALPFAFFHLHKTAVPRSPLSPLRRVRFQIEAGAATKRRRIPANCPVSGFRSASYQQFPAEPPDNLSGFGRIMMSHRNRRRRASFGLPRFARRLASVTAAMGAAAKRANSPPLPNSEETTRNGGSRQGAVASRSRAIPALSASPCALVSRPGIPPRPGRLGKRRRHSRRGNVGEYKIRFHTCTS